MFKKTQLLRFKTTNSVYEELYNFLKYSSNSTRLFNIIIYPSSESGKIKFTAQRLIMIPLAEKFPGVLPEKISLDVSGSIDSKGKLEIETHIPDVYSKYIIGRERIIMVNNVIAVNLEYTISIVEADYTTSMLTYIKSCSYNTAIFALESHILALYEAKKGTVFNNPCDFEIKTIEEFNEKTNNEK